MLPFLKKKPVAGLIISKRTPDEPAGEESHSEESPNEALEACAVDLMRAIEAKDIKAVAEAIRSAYECLEAEEHDEYDELNARAAMKESE